MSDGKDFKQLNILDQKIKRLFPTGMFSGLQLVIELKCGFELFNTRPYHNYETWSHGYYATIPEKKFCEEYASEHDKRGRREIKVEAEDLDVLIDRIKESLDNLDICSSCNYQYKKLYNGDSECRSCREKNKLPLAG